MRTSVQKRSLQNGSGGKRKDNGAEGEEPPRDKRQEPLRGKGEPLGKKANNGRRGEVARPEMHFQKQTGMIERPFSLFGEGKGHQNQGQHGSVSRTTGERRNRVLEKKRYGSHEGRKESPSALKSVDIQSVKNRGGRPPGQGRGKKNGIVKLGQCGSF